MNATSFMVLIPYGYSLDVVSWAWRLDCFVGRCCKGVAMPRYTVIVDCGDGGCIAIEVFGGVEGNAGAPVGDKLTTLSVRFGGIGRSSCDWLKRAELALRNRVGGRDDLDSATGMASMNGSVRDASKC